MNEENSQQDSNFSENQIRKYELAVKITKEAVHKAQVPNISTYTDNLPEIPYHVFAEEKERSVYLHLFIRALPTEFYSSICLSLTATQILEDAEKLMKDSKAQKIFDVSDEERDEIIYDECVTIMVFYIYHLPAVLYHSLIQILRESFANYLKKIIEPRLRKYWENIGLEKNFTLTSDNNLHNFTALFPETKLTFIEWMEEKDKEFSDIRKRAFGDRKAWLTEQKLLELPNDYKKLRLEYKQAKQEYKSLHEAFSQLNPKASKDEWKAKWDEVSREKFPTLIFLNKITETAAGELAYFQLADLYGHGAEYMKKKVREARHKLTAKKARERKLTN